MPDSSKREGPDKAQAASEAASHSERYTSLLEGRMEALKVFCH